MSAYIVDFGTIRGILRAAMVYGVDNRRFIWQDGSQIRELNYDTANEIGQMLIDECVASVKYLSNGKDDLPGRHDREWEQPFSYPLMGRVPTPVEAIKLVHCYNYQTCEHPAWENSNAKTFCAAVLSMITHYVEGYDEAQWGWSSEYANPKLATAGKP